jgi:hypothetical protein
MTLWQSGLSLLQPRIEHSLPKEQAVIQLRST